VFLAASVAVSFSFAVIFGKIAECCISTGESDFGRFLYQATFPFVLSQLYDESA
jgi:hypothetical protein